MGYTTRINKLNDLVAGFVAGGSSMEERGDPLQSTRWRGIAASRKLLNGKKVEAKQGFLVEVMLVLTQGIFGLLPLIPIWFSPSVSLSITKESGFVRSVSLFLGSR